MSTGDIVLGFFLAAWHEIKERSNAFLVIATKSHFLKESLLLF